MTKEEQTEMFNTYYMAGYPSRKASATSKPTYAELEKENAELKGLKDVATLIRANNDTVTTLMQLNNMLVSRNQQLTKAKEIILRLYNAGRDVLMCRAEEKAYDNLSNAINDKRIAQFLEEE